MSVTSVTDNSHWVAEFLASNALFSVLDAQSRAELTGRLIEAHVSAGETLMTEGAVGDAIYILVSGRLRAFVTRAEGEVAVGEIGPGEVVGEMALLTDDTRSATVRALRDSSLFRLGKEEALEFLEKHPKALAAITRLVVERLRRTIRSSGKRARITTLAVLPVGAATDTTAFCDQLATALRQYGSTKLVNRALVESQFGSSASQRLGSDREDGHMTRWLHDLELAESLLLYHADPASTPWTRRCLRQADRILLVAQATGDETLGEAAAELRLTESEAPEVPVDLVLIHKAGVERPSGTKRWLTLHPVDRHYHVRLGVTRDMERLARALTGNEIALVLSGGGARGIAHLGVIRALEETGIPVDVIGGTSFGALVGACYAMGWNDEERIRNLKKRLVESGSQIDLTVPAVALTRGSRVTRNLRALFGDAVIEDFWNRFFCISSNLTRGELMVHREGLAWQAIRCSVSVPGILPPVRSSAGDVLVDGAVMNNFPLDVMQSFHAGGPVLAVDLQAETTMAASGLPHGGVLSGWRLLLQRCNPFGRQEEVPSIWNVLLRTTEMGSVMTSRGLEAEADFVFHPPVAQFGLLDFKAWDTIVDAGYRYAAETLEKSPELLREHRSPKGAS